MKPVPAVGLLFATGLTFAVVALYALMITPVSKQALQAASISATQAATSTTTAGDPGNMTDATGVSGGNTADQVVTPYSTTTYQYKVVYTVDPCTLNTLGKQGWKPVAFGTDSQTGNYLDLGPGQDENCRNQRVYQDLVWVIFELSTSTTDNTITTDTAVSAVYKIVQNVDPCTFNKLGAQGWRVVQFGNNLLYGGVYDETCKQEKYGYFLDWALFELPL